MTNNDIIQFENATLMFRNFAGKESQFNAADNRNFCVEIEDPEFADALRKAGWNVKTKKNHEPEDECGNYLQVKVAFNNYPPKIYTVVGNTKVLMTEETVQELDYADIVSADLIIRPYNYEVNGKKGTKAYLKTAYINLEEDPFACKYEDNGAVKDDDIPF